MVDRNLILQIREALQKVPYILAAYVIGSSTTDVFTKESDFDIVIVMENRDTASVDVVYKLLSHIHYPRDLDLSIVDSHSSPLFLFQIVSTGDRIYSRSEVEAAYFEANVLKTYYDTSHLRNIYFSYLRNKFPYGNQ